MARQRRWTATEEERLLRQVKAFPQNLHKCFLLVGEEIGRSEKAVAGHWYTKLSKRPDVMCFFMASPVHVSKNRKNGMGVESNASIWQRLCRILRNII